MIIILIKTKIMLSLKDFKAVKIEGDRNVAGGGSYTTYNCRSKGDVVFADGTIGFDSDGDGVYECHPN